MHDANLNGSIPWKKPYQVREERETNLTSLRVATSVPRRLRAYPSNVVTLPLPIRLCLNKRVKYIPMSFKAAVGVDLKSC
jgi:hypothetical protein